MEQGSEIPTADGAEGDTGRPAIRATPFHTVGFAFLVAGLVLGVYQGLQYLESVPGFTGLTWSHVHFVTVGGLTQLIFGMLPQLVARHLGRPAPSTEYVWMSFGLLNGGFALTWIGRSFGYSTVYDVGVAAVLVSVVALGVYIAKKLSNTGLRQGLDSRMVLYLVAPVALVFGLFIALGLYTHTDCQIFDVAGGWWGLREAHVHANAWGFLGFVVVGTLYELFPRLVETDLYWDGLKRYSVVLLVLGVVPLSVGPMIGAGRVVTAPGLVLFGTGYLMYFANLVATYRDGTSSGLALSVLVAQIWILGPAGFAPFILFGVPLGISHVLIERGALHFFFMGWALPVALGGLAVFFRNLPSRFDTEKVSAPDALLARRVVPGDVVSVPEVVLWNLGVLGAGISLFFPDQTWSSYLMGVAFGGLAVLWGWYLVKIAAIRWRVYRSSESELSKC